jgi:Asp-tRNAAsn/Glu-tRNAGln amidotransferase B subunit (PET112 homolog)
MAELIKGETGEWEVVIGMEVHAHVIANSKLFSGLRRNSARRRTAT